MKTKSLCLKVCLLLFCLATNLHAQQTPFTKVFYDPAGSAQGYALTKTFDHNYLIAGERNSNALVMKVDPSGNILWSKQVGNSADTRFNAIAPTHDSCYVLAGFIPDANNGGRDIFCTKLNESGDTLWTKAINMVQGAAALTIQQTSDNGFILAGFLTVTGAPYSRIVVVKLDSSGNMTWNNVITSGNEANHAVAIRQTNDGGYILTGDIRNYPPYSTAACLIRLTSTGAVSWAKKVIRSATDYLSGFDVVITPAGFLCYLDTGNNGIVILQTDFSGNILWNQNFQIYSSQIFEDIPRPKLNQTSDGGFVFASAGWGFQPMIKVDATGNYQWAQELAFISTDVVESYDHGYFCLGNGPIMGVKMGPTDNPQIGIIKTDSLGTSSGCVSPMTFSSNTLTVTIAPLTYTTTSAGTMAPSHPEVAGTGLMIFEGCVKITGNTTEKPSIESEFQVNPNPSGGQIQILCNQQLKQPITALGIYNELGEQIFASSNPIPNSIQIDLGDRPNGIYYIRAQFLSHCESRKILICH